MPAIALSARTVGAQSVLLRFLRASAHLPEDTRGAQRELGKAAEVVFGSFVPFKSGRALRGISSDMQGGTAIVTDVARDPKTGYDYIGVTRYGHRVERIYPKHRAAASNLSTRRRREGETATHGYDEVTLGQPALRFTIGGRVLYRRSVAGYHPASDWATDALPAVQSEAEAVAVRLGRKIEARF